MNVSSINRSIVTALAVGVFLLVSGSAAAKSPAIEPDLSGVPAGRGWKLINRTATRIDKDGTTAVRLSEGANDYDGFAVLENFMFADGVIEFDARGKNEPQRSFLGIAFHGDTDRIYDAICFRPFNFKSADAVRRSHSIQYLSHPTYTWSKLRTEHPGQYEKPVDPAPMPDDWFRVRIVVATPLVSVFVNNAAEPSLVVTQLNDRKQGWLALWVSVGSGDFANLRITPAS
ncbi:MAG TPA: hypothetical protein VMC06_12300 [Opitutaceae bacterium]|nr:hypothetical protein [Opitutaceae bacterium]